MSKNWTYSWRLKLLEETPATLSLVKFCEDHGYTYHWIVLSLGELCEEHGYTYHWASGQKPPTKLIAKIQLCTICGSWFIDEFLHVIYANFFSIFVAGFCDLARSESMRVELRGNPLQKPRETENTNKNEGRRRSTTKWTIAWFAGLAIGVQREVGWWKCSCWFTGETHRNRHFQLFSWITNGVASKSGTRLE